MSDDVMQHPSVRHDLIPEDGLFEFAAGLVRAQADALRAAPVGVLSLVESCPRCGGRVISMVGSPVSARCAAGCGWSAYRSVIR